MKLTRRLFLKTSALTGGALASVAAIPPAIARFAPARAAAVVTFFDGQLWLDTSGLSRAYHAPAGARAAAPAAEMTDAELYALYGRI